VSRLTVNLICLILYALLKAYNNNLQSLFRYKLSYIDIINDRKTETENYYDSFIQLALVWVSLGKKFSSPYADATHLKIGKLLPCCK